MISIFSWVFEYTNNFQFNVVHSFLKYLVLGIIRIFLEKTYPYHKQTMPYSIYIIIVTNCKLTNFHEEILMLIVN